MEYLTLLARNLLTLEGVSDIEELPLKNETNATGACKISFNYKGFPLSGLEIIYNGELRFVNIRLTLSYDIGQHKTPLIMELINNFNAKSAYLKAFYIDAKKESNGNESTEFKIVYNIEDVFPLDFTDSIPILDKKIELLSIGPMRLHKELDVK